MRLPQPLLESQFFLFGSANELARALGDAVPPDELAEVTRLAALGLPPATSRLVLAAMMGINPGLLWSFQHRTIRHYRSFQIPKGRKVRRIDAPRVALKVLQKWLSVQLQRVFNAPPHAFGFVPGRSHVQAAAKHCGARWVLSLDIRDFFQSTPERAVAAAFEYLGYGRDASELLASLTCLRGALAQGAPTSPVLSNICFRELDRRLAEIAETHSVTLTRYADDIVFSGAGDVPEPLMAESMRVFEGGPWRLAEEKTEIVEAPRRLKVHGLLVSGARVRLTKGYRNKLRAFKHVLDAGGVREEDISRLRGHLAYGEFVDNFSVLDDL